MRRLSFWYGFLIACTMTIAGEGPTKISEYRTRDLTRGAAADPAARDRFFTWGDGVYRWQSGRPARIGEARDGFDPGGCAFDADGDGHTDLILGRRDPRGGLGELIFLRGPEFRGWVIDTGVSLMECVPAHLFGRRGFLVIHRDTQVRFYQAPEGAGAPWPVRELYSIYTASQQAGLALADVDGDGHVDIYAGNYWIRSPGRFDLPWRLFAIHLHNKSDPEAAFAYAAWPDRLIGVQRRVPASPVRIFRRPADPTQVWPEERVSGGALRSPRSAIAWDQSAVIGHRDGLLAVGLSGQVLWRRKWHPVEALIIWDGRLVAVSAHRVSVWRR